MERFAYEAQLKSMTQMLDYCKSKTVRATHNSDQITNEEKTQFQNCILKMTESSAYVVEGLQGMQKMR